MRRHLSRMRYRAGRRCRLTDLQAPSPSTPAASARAGGARAGQVTLTNSSNESFRKLQAQPGGRYVQAQAEPEFAAQ